VLGHANNLLIVCTLLHNHIDFEISEACFLSCSNSIKYIRNWEVDIIHFFEDVVVQSIKANRQTLQACCFQCGSLLA
jgi:hypothetical protein